MKRALTILLWVVSQFATPLFAQFDFPPMGGASSAMGGTSVALDDDESAVTGIAGLAWLKSGMAALSCRNNFNTEGLGYIAAAFAMPVNVGGWSLSAVHYGNVDYNEQRVSLAYALPLSKTLSLGAAFHYLHSGTSDPYYDPLNRLTFSVAMLLRPDDRLSVAFKAFNPIAVTVGDQQGSHSPAVFNLGVAYWLLEDMQAVAEVEKNYYRPASLRFGMQYRFFEDYYFRMGLATNPVIYTFGMAMQKDHLGLSMAFQIHSVLGMTPHLSLNYRF